MIDLKNTSLVELGEMLIKVSSQLSKALEEEAKDEAVFKGLKDFKDTVFSKCMPDEGSVAYKEKLANTHADFVQHIEGMRNAREAHLISKARVAGLQAKFDALRTVISSQKEEIKNFGG